MTHLDNDRELQRIRTQLTESLPTVEFEDPEPLVPPRRRNLLTKIKRRYDVLDDRWQAPVVWSTCGITVLASTTRAICSYTLRHPKACLVGSVAAVTLVVTAPIFTSPQPIAIHPAPELATDTVQARSGFDECICSSAGISY